MKLFELTFAGLTKYVAAEDADHAKAIGEDPAQSPDMHFRPFEVIEIQVEGYEITVTPVAEEPTEPEQQPVDTQPNEPPESPESAEGTNDTQEPANDSQQETEGDSEASNPIIPGVNQRVNDLIKEELRAWLDERKIEYVPQWGEKRLRELVLQHIENTGEQNETPLG